MSAGSLRFAGLGGCRKCDLAKGRRRVVFGYGSWPADMMFIAEAPGRVEDREGKPLVGETGTLLREVLTECGIDPDEQFLSNVVLCRPPFNRDPKPAEVAACGDWLTMQIAKVDPKVIVPLGGFAYRWFLPDESSTISEIRGNPFLREVVGKERIIVPTWHPAFVARNERAYRPQFRADIAHAKDILERGMPEPLPFAKDRNDLDDVVDVIQGNTTWGFDLETAGPSTKRGRPIPRHQEVVGVGVCAEPGQAKYWPEPDHAVVLESIGALKPALENPANTVVVSNAKFELHVMQRYGVEIHTVRDTLIEAWLLADTPLALKDAFHRSFGREMIRISSVMGKGKTSRDMRTATIEDEEMVIEYAAQDPDASLRLHTLLMEMVSERGMEDLYLNVELPFMRLIVEMERNGMKFNPEALAEARVELDSALSLSLAKCIALVGHEFSPGSAEQTAALLYGWIKPHTKETPGVVKCLELAKIDHLYRIPYPPRYQEATGKNPGTDKVTLAEHIGNVLVREVLTYRGLKKMISTYIDGLPKFIDVTTGRIHCDINQVGTITGRVSSRDPNMTNIPSRTRDDVEISVPGSFIRTGFVANEGNYLYAADLSQIEMRMAANLSADAGMIEQLTMPDGDIHSNTARRIFKTTPEAMIATYGENEGKARWKNMRYLAKTIGFGVLYGLTPHGLLMRTPTLGLTIEEATHFIAEFYATYPDLQEWQKTVKRFVRKYGYFETLLGRRRYFPNITARDRHVSAEAANAAVNFPVQGGAADYFKLACIAVWERMRQLKMLSIPVNQVHDEFVGEGPKAELEVWGTELIPVMCDRMELLVPVLADLEVGLNWGELYDYEDIIAGKTPLDNT
jgi:DNA polymerase I